MKRYVFGLALVANLWAAPENPAPFTIDNQGDSLTLRRVGDEHYNYVQTVDGFLVLEDSSGCYYYADEFGKVSPVKAKDSSYRNQDDLLFLKSLSKKDAYDAHRKSHPPRLMTPEKKRKRASWLSSGKVRTKSLQKVAGHANGTNSFPVILVAGSDLQNCDSLAYYERLNLEGYSKDKHTGSVRDYFIDQSNGKFVPSYDLYLVSVPNVLSSYKQTEYNLVIDALNALKKKYPNFDATKYDADNDGIVDVVAVIFAGSRKSAGLGGQQYDLKWAGGVQTLGGKKFGPYILAAQLEDEGPLKRIGSFIHEFGHSLGLGDHYSVYNDPVSFSTQYPGAHAWDVMATGMYNNSGATPAGYSAYEKNFLGWMDYKSFDQKESVATIPPLNETNVAYKIPVPGDDDEWFILENRQLSKWDSGLPNHGMLIWHIDYDYDVWYRDRINDDDAHQHVDVVEAGNLKVSGYYDGFKADHLKDDPFPGSQDVTSFAGFKSWSGTDLGIKLFSITEKNGNVCFATAPGVDVGDCVVKVPVVESSSSMTPEIADVSSSSENKDGTISLSAVSSGIQMALNDRFLQLSMSTQSLRTVSVFDVMGNRMLSADVSESFVALDLSKLGQGTFVVSISEKVAGRSVRFVQRFTLR